MLSVTWGLLSRHRVLQVLSCCWSCHGGSWQCYASHPSRLYQSCYEQLLVKCTTLLLVSLGMGLGCVA